MIKFYEKKKHKQLSLLNVAMLQTVYPKWNNSVMNESICFIIIWAVIIENKLLYFIFPSASDLTTTATVTTDINETAALTRLFA